MSSLMRTNALPLSKLHSYASRAAALIRRCAWHNFSTALHIMGRLIPELTIIFISILAPESYQRGQRTTAWSLSTTYPIFPQLLSCSSIFASFDTFSHSLLPTQRHSLPSIGASSRPFCPYLLFAALLRVHPWISPIFLTSSSQTSTLR